MQAAKRTPVDLRAWAVSLMERDNRKSHLAPQLSPGTQELLRSNNSPDNNADDRALETPTSGEIPIVGAIIQSPRDQHNSISNRSPTRSDRGGSISAGRSNGPPVHPGLGPRVATTNSIPKMAPPPPPRHGQHSPSPSLSSNSGKQASFALPIRPPPGGPLPPPPRRQAPHTPDDTSHSGGNRGSRRQATIGLPHGSMSVQGMGFPPVNGQVRRE